MKFKLSICALLFLMIFGCKPNNSEENQFSETAKSNTTKAAVVLNMEGETHTMQLEAINPQKKLDFDKDDLQYVIYTNESTVSINFNLKGSNVLKNGPTTYTIPDANEGAIIIDLSFFNKDRNVEKRSNKRIVFRSGTITISKLTKNSLIMNFEGKGNGMIERGETLFPISGSINITY